MVLFNYSTRELTAKIVYYGPGLCGKTTNLQFIFDNLPSTVKGKMLSLATKTDRTLFFDFLPLDLGEIRGMKTRIQLYTVPGQVFYNETRRLVLKGADGVVFVADSQKQMIDANVDSFRNLEENLRVHSMKLSEMPLVFQFNKRDLPNLASIDEMNAAINRQNCPFYESVATTGIGVQDTLKAITKLVLLHLTKRYDTKKLATEPVAVGSSPASATPAAQGSDLEVVGRSAASAPPQGAGRVAGATASIEHGVDEEIEEDVVDLTEEYEEPEAVVISAASDDEPIELVDEVEETVASSEAAMEQVFDIEEIGEDEISEVRPDKVAARPAGAGIAMSTAGSLAGPEVRGARPHSASAARPVSKPSAASVISEEEPTLVPRIVLGQDRLITVPVDIEHNGTITRVNLSISVRITKPPRSS